MNAAQNLRTPTIVWTFDEDGWTASEPMTESAAVRCAMTWRDLGKVSVALRSGRVYETPATRPL